MIEEGQDDNKKSETCRVITGTILFFICFAPVLWVLEYLPDIPLVFPEAFDWVYHRPAYRTDDFSISKFFSFVAAMAMGFIFFTIVTDKRNRGSIWMSRDGSFKDIRILMLIVTPILYFLAPIIFIRSKNDLDLYCAEKSAETSVMSGDGPELTDSDQVI